MNYVNRIHEYTLAVIREDGMSVSDLNIQFNQSPPDSANQPNELHRLYRNWLLQTLDIYMVRYDVAMDDEINADDLIHMISDLELYSELLAVVKLHLRSHPCDR